MKAAITLIALLIMMLSAGVAHTQAMWIDSLKKAAVVQRQPGTGKINTLIAISNYYSFIEPDSAFLYGQQALALAEQINDTKGEFWAIVYSNKALYMLGNYALELSFAFRALPLAQTLKDPNALGWSLGMLGDCYFNLGQYDTALSYYRRVKKSAERDSMIDLYSMYSGLVPVFVQLGKSDSALFYAKKGFALQQKNPLLNGNDEMGNGAKAIVYRFMGEAFAAFGNADSALCYYQRSIPYAEKNGFGVNTIDVYNGMAAVYLKMRQPALAIQYAEKLLNAVILRKYPAGYLAAANTLTASFEQLHKADSTLKYLRMAYSVSDSLFNRNKTIAIQNVFFNEKQGQKDIAAATSKLHEQYSLYVAIALMMIGLVIAGIVLRNKRLRQLQLIRNNIADDLHDDIGSALSSISIMSELAKQKSPQALPLLVSIEENTWAIQDNMNDIIWTIKSENDRFDNVLQRMQVFTTQVMDTQNIQSDFSIAPAVATVQLSMKQRKNFYLFFKEVINNAAKYAAAKKVTIVIAKTNQFVEMVVTDDGKGFDTTKMLAGNGMGSLKKRAAELNGSCSIRSFIGEGTAVTLRFKIT